MQTILIPTDFTIESLGLLKTAMQECPDEQFNVVLVHGIIPDDSIQDLLFRSPNKIIKELQSTDFAEACTVIRNKFSSRILSLKTVLFTGKTKSAFRNLLKANAVDVIVSAEHYAFQFPSRKSLDLAAFIRSSEVKKLNMEWESRPDLPEKNKLAELFAL